MKTLLTVIAMTALPAMAFAHPGHGADGGDFGVIHYLTTPEHLIPAAIGAALVAGSVTWRRRLRLQTQRAERSQRMD